jgi:hypothetical protein
MNPEDHMSPPHLTPTRAEELRGLEGLAQREAQIPAHFALSLSELRAQAQTQPQAEPTPSESVQVVHAQAEPQAEPTVTAHTATVIADSTPDRSTCEPLVYPVETWVDVPTLEALIPRIAEQLERIAESDSPIHRSALLGLARRLSAVEVGDPALRLARQRRLEGMRWRAIAEELNERIEKGESRFTRPNGKLWSENNLRSLDTQRRRRSR